jgi:hypothetical protein
MHVRILSNCWADGRLLSAGELVDISEETARSLIAIGRAEHASATVEDVATVVTATDAELAEADSATAKPPTARRGRPPATPTTTTTEED